MISSTGSRVVPAVSLTTTRSWPAMEFSSEDLPTLGRPTRAMRCRSPSGAAVATAETSGRTSITASRTSPLPRPCRAETGKGSPSPRFHRVAASPSCAGESTLLAAKTTGLPLRRSIRTTRASVSVMPTWASTTSRTASAISTATSAWVATAASRPATSTSQPPVSTMVKRRPAHSAG